MTKHRYGAFLGLVFVGALAWIGVWKIADMLQLSWHYGIVLVLIVALVLDYLASVYERLFNEYDRRK